MAEDEANKFKTEANEFKLLSVPWFDLPLSIRQMWWKETDYNRLPPSQEFTAQMPQLLAAAKLEVENDKREIAAELAAGRAFEPSATAALRPVSAASMHRALPALDAPRRDGSSGHAPDRGRSGNVMEEP